MEEYKDSFFRLALSRDVYAFRHKSGKWLTTAEIDECVVFFLTERIEHAVGLYKLPSCYASEESDFEKIDAFMLPAKIEEFFNDQINFEDSRKCPHILLSHSLLIDKKYDELKKICTFSDDEYLKMNTARSEIYDYIESNNIDYKDVVINERIIHAESESGTDFVYINFWPEKRILH